MQLLSVRAESRVIANQITRGAEYRERVLHLCISIQIITDTSFRSQDVLFTNIVCSLNDY